MIPCRIIDCEAVGIEITYDMEKSEVIRNLSRAWDTVPSWRMGQLLHYLATFEEETDLFNITDERFSHACHRLIKEHENDLTNVFPLHAPLTREAYLEECKKTLDEGDYLDVLCGIHEVEFYAAMENDLKAIVNTYYSYSQ